MAERRWWAKLSGMQREEICPDLITNIHRDGLDESKDFETRELGDARNFMSSKLKKHGKGAENKELGWRLSAPPDRTVCHQVFIICQTLKGRFLAARFPLSSFVGALYRSPWPFLNIAH